MIKKLICIVCPNGCALEAELCGGEISVSGNKCKRGADYAKKELTCPMRTVCSTVKTAYKSAPVLPVRTSREVPKERMLDVMKEINSVYIEKPVVRGDIIIKNVCGFDSDIIATSDILKEAAK